MVTILEASVSDITFIQELAHTTWPITYGEILSKEQLDYMLDLIYSEEALSAHFDKKEQLFYLIFENDIKLGFTSVEHNYNGDAVTKIHKIYLSPETQGRGIGKKAIDKITEMALKENAKALILNVNRFNKALDFYKKIGFDVADEVNIDIGNGYLMEDYVMEKKI